MNNKELHNAALETALYLGLIDGLEYWMFMGIIDNKVHLKHSVSKDRIIFDYGLIQYDLDVNKITSNPTERKVYYAK